MSEPTTLIVTDGIVLFRSRILKPRAGFRLRVVEEVDPPGVPTPAKAPFVPELFNRGIPGARPLES